MTDVAAHTGTALVVRAVRNAARRTAIDLFGAKNEHNNEMHQRLEMLTEELCAVAGGHGGSSTRIANVPRRNVDFFRKNLLDQLSRKSADADLEAALRVLSALEQHHDSNSAPNQFADRLDGHDALDAVVEMAHDMRSPLSSILFLVDTIRRSQSGSINKVQERQLGLIYGAALGLNTLASDAIDAVRGHGLVDGRPVPFSITENVGSVIDLVRPVSEEKGLVIETALTAKDGRMGYPSALSRVLLNLVVNALRFTDRGSVTIGCRDHSPTSTEFWVSDTGRGIPPKIVSMLFDGFRPSASGLRFSSAGLGLAICRNLLTAMNSQLEVETALEHGTRFSFTLELPYA